MAKRLTIRAVTVGRMGEPGHAVYEDDATGNDWAIRFIDGQLGVDGRRSLANARGWAQREVAENPDCEGAEITED